ncbi:glycosyltransferase family 39 protein [uncultured Limimaricola sp.]|uniref:glycosyltransferase family 39 protein n=1 Tax=uncultured Limimaricola sp. TaxID=2211667 RepID=UPI0030F9B79B
MTSDRAWIALIISWAMLQVAWRFVQGPALELDEAEAFYFARDLALGYNAQPPLYFWGQWVVFALVGQGIFGLALFKYALLGMAGLALYGMLRRLRPPFEAGVAVMGLALLPQVLWEAQRALTHSVLALTMSLIIMALADRVLRGPGRAGLGAWIALGVAAGLGAISKWNVALVPIAILVAVGLRAEWRSRIVPLGAIAAVVTAVAVVAAPAWWVMHNPMVAGGSLHKLGFEEAAPLWRMLQGLGSLASAWIAFCGLVILIGGMIAIAARGRARWHPDPQSRLMLTTMVAGAVLLMVGVVFSGATEIADRWLLPIAVFSGPVVVLWALDTFGPRGRAWLTRGLAVLWLLGFALLPVSGRVEPGYRAADYAGLAGLIEAHHPDAAVVTDSIWVAGNLALIMPDRPVFRSQDAPHEAGPVLWVARSGTAQALAASKGYVAVSEGRHPLPRGRREEALDLALSR